MVFSSLNNSKLLELLRCWPSDMLGHMFMPSVKILIQNLLTSDLRNSCLNMTWICCLVWIWSHIKIIWTTLPCNACIMTGHILKELTQYTPVMNLTGLFIGWIMLRTALLWIIHHVSVCHKENYVTATQKPFLCHLSFTSTNENLASISTFGDVIIFSTHP